MSVLDRILEQAAAHPERPAAKDPTVQLTFGALERGVARTAAGLARSGLAGGDRVALHLENSVAFLVCALACMKLGAVFAPLSVDDPDPRLSAIVADWDPKLVVSEVLDAPQLEALSRGARPLATPRELARDEGEGGGAGIESEAVVGRAAVAYDDDSPVYCIYTSGTTGTPKGVVIGNRAFECAVTEAARLMELGPGTRALCVSPFHFDGSYGTLFPVPVAGGCLVIPRRETLLFPRVFFRAIRDEGINHTSFSPSYLRLLLASPELSKLAPGSLRTMALGGEACDAGDIIRLWKAAPALRIFNRYGPTETTIAVTTHELRRNEVRVGKPVPIGVPHKDVSFVLIANDGSVVDGPDCKGELYVGGAQLMDGYWHEPSLTNAVMRKDLVTGKTLYRTGDLAVRGAEGLYTCLGRIDSVVKRRGIRISLDEIAHAVAKSSGGRAVHCAAYEIEGEVAIAAFVVSRRDDGGPKAEGREPQGGGPGEGGEPERDQGAGPGEGARPGEGGEPERDQGGGRGEGAQPGEGRGPERDQDGAPGPDQGGEPKEGGGPGAEPGGAPEALEIRARLLEYLPLSMAPDHIEVVDAFPLTTSGKVDERALLEASSLRPWTRAPG